MIKVLIQAEAGSCDKVRFDEKTLDPIGTGRVSLPYPYPYGFVIATTAADGDNVDCYVLCSDDLRSGSIVACEPVGLLEQEETGQPDHKVLAVVAGQDEVIPEEALEEAKNNVDDLNIFERVALENGQRINGPSDFLRRLRNSMLAC